MNQQRPIEQAVVQSNLTEPPMGQQVSNAGASVQKTTSDWWNRLTNMFSPVSPSTNPSGNTGGGRRKKKATKRAKKSVKKTKRAKK